MKSRDNIVALASGTHYVLLYAGERMKKTYYSTFIPGLLEPVQHALTTDLPQSRILTALDGLVVYESVAPIDVIRNLPFVTNTFCVLKAFTGDRAKSVEAIARDVLRDRLLDCSLPFPVKPSHSFRVVVSRASELVAIKNDLMTQLEQWIRARSGLVLNRSKPDIQFWILQRTEGYGFFSVRITKHKSYDKILRKGELRPELANILCRLSEPIGGELFLDPFCGSGAIPIQRAKYFPQALVIASDNDQKTVNSLSDRVKELGLQKRIVVRSDDALHLTRYNDSSIHKIVTDPPWGHFVELGIPLEVFYRRIMTEFGRVLQNKGRLVMLTAQASLTDEIIEHCVNLTLLRKYNILLSGKKASVYVLVRG